MELHSKIPFSCPKTPKRGNFLRSSVGRLQGSELRASELPIKNLNHFIVIFKDEIGNKLK
jgi:hypothetical protein